MSFNDFMAKIRYWDNLTAKWIMRQFYLFQIPLVAIFIVWLFNTLDIIDTSVHTTEMPLVEKMLNTQSINVAILVLLFLFNSFWMIYIFSTLQNIRLLLRDINYNTSRLKTKDRPSTESK